MSGLPGRSYRVTIEPVPGFYCHFRDAHSQRARALPLTRPFSARAESQLLNIPAHLVMAMLFIYTS